MRFPWGWRGIAWYNGLGFPSGRGGHRHGSGVAEDPLPEKLVIGCGTGARWTHRRDGGATDPNVATEPKGATEPKRGHPGRGVAGDRGMPWPLEIGRVRDVCLRGMGGPTRRLEDIMMRRCCVGILVSTAWLSLAAPGVAEEPPDPLQGVDPGWLDSFTRKTHEQARFLQAAYDLSEEEVRQLRAELRNRLGQQVDFDRDYQGEKKAYIAGLDRSAPPTSDSAERRAVHQAKMRERLGQMPLNEERVAEWLGARMPAERAANGRQRLKELWFRRTQHRSARINDAGRRVGLKARQARGRSSRQAPISSTGAPMPHGRKADPVVKRAEHDAAKRIVRPDQGTRRRTEEPRRGSESSPPPAVYPTAPPLDEWEKYVVRVAEQYAFTDVQVTKARSILHDLRRRAYQYQLSRSADFAKAELSTDKKARQAKLETLNEPLDALFMELRQRLEALPTLEQIQRAGAPKGRPNG